MQFITEPLDIVDLPADKRHYSNNRIGYEIIFIHATDGTDSRAWLSTTSNPPVSSHRLVRNGILYKIVPDQYVAFTQGFGHMEGIQVDLNRIGLSIEIENDGTKPYSDEDLLLCAQQVVEWHGLYGFISVLPHHYVESNKPLCPIHFPWARYYTMYQKVLSQYI